METFKCDENCPRCTYIACVEHPNHKSWEREEREYPPKKCAYCGEEFIPTSPAQKYCSRNENPACDDQRFFDSLSPMAFIRFHGYRNKEEIIREHGTDAWAAIQP